MAHRPLLFLGHHKAATTWCQTLLRDICRELNLKMGVANTAEEFRNNLRNYFDQRTCDFLCWTNAEYSYLEQLDDFRAFHLIRDPRDMAVSAFFSHRNSHPTAGWAELDDHRKRLLQLDPKEALLCDLEFTRRLPTNGYEVRPIDSMNEWNYRDERVYEVRFEELFQNPYFYFIEILNHLGIACEEAGRTRELIHYLFAKHTGTLGSLPTWRILALLRKHDFRKLTGGRKPGVQDVSSHLRKGVPGDWVNHFGTEHIARFKEYYPTVLTGLGYQPFPSDAK